MSPSLLTGAVLVSPSPLSGAALVSPSLLSGAALVSPSPLTSAALICDWVAPHSNDGAPSAASPGAFRGTDLPTVANQFKAPADCYNVAL